MYISKTQLRGLLLRYSHTADFIQEKHAQCILSHQSTGGHDFSHDLMVAQFAFAISPDENTATLAWLAGICHSFDRITPNFATGDEQVLDQKLELDGVETVHRHIILQAVKEHDGPNTPNDHIVKVALQDADRLANTKAIVVMRTGQYRSHLPAVELGHLDHINPASTYREPRSVLDNLRFLLEWRDHPQFGLRLPLAKEVGRAHFAWIEEHIDTIRRDFRELGIT